MNLVVAILLALPQGGKNYKPWQAVYEGIQPKGGSDAYGYTYMSTQDGDNVNYQWIDITTTGTNLNLGDDDSASVILPFVFKMYKDTTSTIHVQSNGGITFRNIKLSFSNHALPDTNGTLIAVYWSDQNPSSNGAVYYQAFGDTMVVIEWYNVPEYNASTYNTYEAIIYKDGRIKLQYAQITDYSDETIGIQSGNAFSTGNGWYLQYVYDSTPPEHVPGDSTAILFAPPVPQDHDVGTLEVSTSGNTFYTDDTVHITATVKNFGLNSESFGVRFIIDTSSITLLDTTISPVTLDTGQVANVTLDFVTQVSGEYNITSFTVLASDTNYINDTAKSSFHVIDFMSLPYSTDFESDSGYFYHEGTNDPWQWGIASHVHSGTKAWATILNGEYPSNAEAYLYTLAIDLSSFSSYDSTYATFWYLDSLESNYDYVYLLVTDDRGQTWDTVKTYTGYATEWNMEYIDLKPYNGKKIQMAFAFHSDGSVTKAGFFFDDFEIGIPLDNDVGIRNIEINPQVVRPHDSAEINIYVHNFGQLDQSNFQIKALILKSADTLYVDSFTIGTLPHSEDTTINITFAPSDTGLYSVIAFTELTTDENTKNDTSFSYFECGRPQILFISYKIGGDGIADPGESGVPVILKVTNRGAQADSLSLVLSSTSSHVTIQDTQHFIGQVPYNDTIIDTFFIDVSSDANISEEADFTLKMIAENGYENAASFSILIGGKLWTIMVLINGDNNLTSYGVSDVDEMEQTGSNDLVNILVQFDGQSSYEDSAGTHQDANRYYITHHPGSNDMIDAYPLVNLGEVNMGDTNVIFDFFKWGVDNYPAKHYMFIIWDHGSGWVKGTVSKGVSHDDTNNDYLSFANGEARALFRKMKNYLGRNIDIIGYDVCLVQMIENIEEAYGFADNVVASEKSEPGDGWDYNFLAELAANPNMTPEELAGTVVNYYSSYYSSQSDVTLSALKLNSAMGHLRALINSLSAELIKAGGIIRSDIQNIISNLDGEVEATYEPYKYFVDIKHLAQELKNANINASINNLCDSIIALYDSGGFIINSWASSDVASSMYGISLMLPPSGESLDGWEAPYNNLLFAKHTLWYNFLRGDTSLTDTPRTTLHWGYIEVNGSITDTLHPSTNANLRLTLSNYSNTPDSGVIVVLKAPPFISLTADSFEVAEVPRDTLINQSIPFNVSEQAPQGGYSLEVTIYTTHDASTYYIPFSVMTSSQVDNRPAGYHHTLLSRTVISQNDDLHIKFSLKRPGKVSVKLYDIQGRLVKHPVNRIMYPGPHALTIPARDLKGIYFVVINTPEGSTTHKILVIK